jgi:O-acetyl-ADP-ribose deacetylase (regulator of RNase III)
MITEIDADLLEYPLGSFGQFCNCQCVQAAGIALRIRQKYPEAFEADLRTKPGDRTKMGTFSYAVTENGKYIINCYTQFGYGYGSRYTSYDAVCCSLEKVEKFLQDKQINTFGLPRNAGCRLGGGNYTIVKAIIESIFANSSVVLYICNYDK